MAHPWDKLSEEEWEAICNRCGRCCLYPLEDIDTGEIYRTNILCRYFDLEKSACTVYDKRCTLVPSCLKLTKDNVDKLPFMPKTCTYRKLFDADYKDKPYLPLKGRVVREEDVDADNLEDYIVDEDEL